MSVTLHTTHGDVKLELFCSAVPKTCYNFLAYAATDRFNGSPLHRNIRDFMIQGGSTVDEYGNFDTKKSESVYGGTFEDEVKGTLRFNARGIVGMANKGPSTNGSQFFVTYKACPHLDGKNTVFGKVIGEMDALDVMETVEVDKKSRPKEPILIQRVTIHANPLADE